MLALALLQVVSTTACPSADAVRAELAALLPVEAAGAVERAELGEVDGALTVGLAAGGRRVAARTLAVGEDCAARARAAAVVIAAWHQPLGDETGGANASAKEEASAKEKASAKENVSVSVGARAGRRVRWAVSAGFTASLAGAAFAPGATATVLLAGPRSRFAGRLAVTGLGYRDLALGPGAASWTRASIALGPAYRFSRGRVALDGHAEALVALLTVRGVGFDTTRQAFDVDPGLGAGARLLVRAGPVTPFVGVSVAGWLRRQQVRVTNTDLAGELPRFEVLLEAGVGFGDFF